MLALALNGCAHAPSATPGSYGPGSAPPIVGVASWYGPGFNGKRTADGEIYNQEDLTAASSRFKLGTRVMVTNLDNGRSVEVRINDRGPFMKGREIDLSHRAAEILGIINPGTARVRIDVLGSPGATQLALKAAGYWVQVGSFSKKPNAIRLRDSLAQTYSDVQVNEVEAGSRRYYRVQMGSFGSREDASVRAAASRHLGLPVIIVSE